MGSLPTSASTRTSLEDEHGFSLAAVFAGLERPDGAAPAACAAVTLRALLRGALAFRQVKGSGSQQAAYSRGVIVPFLG